MSTVHHYCAGFFGFSKVKSKDQGLCISMRSRVLWVTVGSIGLGRVQCTHLLNPNNKLCAFKVVDPVAVIMWVLNREWKKTKLTLNKFYKYVSCRSISLLMKQFLTIMSQRQRRSGVVECWLSTTRHESLSPNTVTHIQTPSISFNHNHDLRSTLNATFGLPKPKKDVN